MNFKMKSALAVLMVGSMISTNATIARLKALGMAETDNEGSYFIKDDRNIFLNVANIHDHADTMILEWGGNGNTFGSASLATDTDASPKAKGGFLKSHGDYVYGVYLGNESNTSALLRGVATGAYSSQYAITQAGDTMLDGADNQVDLFFGGKTGMGNWAVNFVWTSDSEQANRARDIAHAVRFGFKTEKWDVFANISTRNKAQQVDTLAAGTGQNTGFAGGEAFHQFDGNLGIHIGGGYDISNEGRIYGLFKKFSWDQTDSLGQTSGLTTTQLPAAQFGQATNGRGQAGTVEGGFTTYALGYGHQKNFGKSTLFTSVEFRSKTIEASFTAKAEAENVIAPLMVGYEHNTTSWLTLRGSITQNLYGYRKNNNYSSLGYIGAVAAIQEFGADTGGKKVTLTNSTDVAAGASLNFGKLTIDGFIGTTARSRNPASAAAGRTEQGILSTDNLLTRVGMTYNF
jgi:hypothetical protein